MEKDIEVQNRRSAMTGFARSAISGVLAIGALASVAIVPAVAAADKVNSAKSDSRKWIASFKGNPKKLAPYFKALAAALEKGDNGPLVEYKKSNPDYPDNGDAGKICWRCLGNALIAIGEFFLSLA